MANKRRMNRTSTKYKRARVRHMLFTHGPHRLSGGRITQRHLAKGAEVREIEVVSATWPKEFDGLRIGHISDIHYGALMPVELALQHLDLLAAQEPDLLACTGDVIDLHHAGAEPIFEGLAAIPAPLGSFLVLGNHDELECRKSVRSMALAAGLILLENDTIEIAHNSGRLVVAGINWANSQKRCGRLVAQTCDAGVHVLLSHNPKAFKAASDARIPITLAGHTHGGQIAARRRPNTNLSITHRRSVGLFEKDGSHLYVTSGLGAWFPLRVNCPAEIAMITIRSGPA